MKVEKQKCYKQKLIDYEHIYAITQRGKNTDLFLNPSQTVSRYYQPLNPQTPVGFMSQIQNLGTHPIL